MVKRWNHGKSNSGCESEGMSWQTRIEFWRSPEQADPHQPCHSIAQQKESFSLIRKWEFEWMIENARATPQVPRVWTSKCQAIKRRSEVGQSSSAGCFFWETGQSVVKQWTVKWDPNQAINNYVIAPMKTKMVERWGLIGENLKVFQ